MAKTNVLFSFNSYEDSAASNNPNMNHFKWTRQVVNADCEEPQSVQTVIQPGISTELFNDSISLAQDNTTEYTLSYVSSGTYKLSHSNGTPPVFRTLRSIGGGNDTEITVTVSGSAVTFTNTSGTPLNLTSVVIGDEVIISDPLSSQNKGTFKILAKTSNSFTIENKNGAAEVVVFGSSSPFLIQSASGVQIGDKVYLPAGFGAAIEGVYSVKSVKPDELTLASSATLPGVVVVSQISVFSHAKKAVYIECQKPIKITINGGAVINVKPSFLNGPGMAFLNDTIWSLSAEPIGVEAVTVFLASVE